MSATAITLICFGLLVIFTRGPLIFAPERVRDFYLQLILNAANMRIFGVVLLGFSMLIIWATRYDVGLPSDIVSGFFWFTAVMSAVLIIPYPGLVGRMGTPIWSKFGPTTLRFLGFLSVVIAAWIVYYGFYLG